MSSSKSKSKTMTASKSKSRTTGDSKTMGDTKTTSASKSKSKTMADSKTTSASKSKSKTYADGKTMSESRSKSKTMTASKSKSKTTSAEMPETAELSDKVIRILGLNPGPKTGQGTNTYLVGSGSGRVLIDAGSPGVKDYIKNLIKTLNDNDVCLQTILVTHWHEDHVGGVNDVLKKMKPDTSCKVSKIKREDKDDEPLLDGKVEYVFVKDGDTVKADGATLQIIHTPGHTSDHMAILFKEENAIFCGDCVLGEGNPQYEDWKCYSKSLNKLLKLCPTKMYPGHGPVIEDPKKQIQKYLDRCGAQRDSQSLKTKACDKDGKSSMSRDQKSSTKSTGSKKSCEAKSEKKSSDECSSASDEGESRTQKSKKSKKSECDESAHPSSRHESGYPSSRYESGQPSSQEKSRSSKRTGDSAEKSYASKSHATTRTGDSQAGTEKSRGSEKSRTSGQQSKSSSQKTEQLEEKRAEEVFQELQKKGGPVKLDDLVKGVYKSIPPDLNEAAQENIRKHLATLADKGLIEEVDTDEWKLKEPSAKYY